MNKMKSDKTDKIDRELKKTEKNEWIKKEKI